MQIELILKIKDFEIRLTKDETRELKEKLENLLKKKVVYPYSRPSFYSHPYLYNLTSPCNILHNYCGVQKC